MITWCYTIQYIGDYQNTLREIMSTKECKGLRGGLSTAHCEYILHWLVVTGTMKFL